jgi:hypothetical protein
VTLFFNIIFLYKSIKIKKLFKILMHLTYKLVHFFWQKIRKTTRNRDKDLEKGKQGDTASAMEACTEKASGDTETRACRAAVATHVAAMEGKTAPDRRRLTAMEQNKIDKRMAKAGVQSFAKKIFYHLFY